MEANTKKKVLKRLMKDIDAAKSGLVKDEAFFTILNLSGISLSSREQSKIKKSFSKSGKTEYIPALQALTINLDSSAVNDERWKSHLPQSRTVSNNRAITAEPINSDKL